MPAYNSTDPRDVAPILAALIQSAELPAGGKYRPQDWAFDATAEDGKVTLLLSDPMRIRSTQKFELTLTFLETAGRPPGDS